MLGFSSPERGGPCAGATHVQSLGWYRNRLLSMQPGEIAWRVSNLVRDKVDRALLARRQKTLAALPTTAQQPTSIERNNSTYSSLIPQMGAQPPYAATWQERVVAEADDILRHRIRLLGSRLVDVGTPIRWNHEHSKNAPTPTIYAGDIDYRDYDETGDCKWVWELNRHHHLVVLGRAYRLSGDAKYAREVVSQILSWMDACEFGTGMNWRSPLELSIRLINWTYALEMIEPAGVVNDDARNRIEAGIYQHLWDISRKYSRFSSANNHLIGEAAGVYVAACRYAHLPNAMAWRDEARRILAEEIVNQIDADGVHKELATGYHLFVLQFFIIAYVAGTHSGDAFSAEFEFRLLAMCDFLAALSAAGPMPLFNDCDDGYVLDLGGERGNPSPWIHVGDVLRRGVCPPRLEGAGPPLQSGRIADDRDREAAYWLVGEPSSDRTHAEPRSLESMRFEEAGIYLLQTGNAGSADAISATVDVGPLGFKSIAAHGHADALSITLRAFGVEFLIDPGTYDYFTHAEWRDYFRTTRAHNTIEIDGQDQSEMLGKFLWGRRANASCIDWHSDANVTRLAAEHDGYARLADPVIHRRTVELDASASQLRIDDELRGAASHNGALHFHFAPECRVERIGDQTILATRNEGVVELSLPDNTNVTLIRGETSPILGWCSRAYHEKQPVTTVRATFDFDRSACLKSTVHICKT